PSHQFIASMYAITYSAMAFGVLVSVRGRQLPRAQSPAGLLLTGAALLALAALLTSARLLGLAPYATGVGQSFWGVGIGMVGIAALRASRVDGSVAVDGLQSVVQDESRLRLLPSSLAGIVVIALAAVQAWLGQPPMEGTYLAALTLLSLLVLRQM